MSKKFEKYLNEAKHRIVITDDDLEEIHEILSDVWRRDDSADEGFDRITDILFKLKK